MDPLVESLLAAIRSRGLLAPGTRVLVACSGGVDSVVLAHALRALAPEGGWTVAIGHVDHGLRPESGEDAAWVRDLAASWGLAGFERRVHLAPEPGESPEAAARHARHAALDMLAREAGAEAIALAHHADDQLETVLYRLTKGASLKGLVAMPWRRELAGGLALVRPMLGLSRSEIEAYGGRHGLAWREDPTNRDARIPRNRLRHAVAPVLRDLNPALARTLTTHQDLLADEDRYLDEATAWAFRPLLRPMPEGVRAWEVEGFRGLDPVLQRRAIAHMWHELCEGPTGRTTARIETLLRRWLAGEPGAWDAGEGLSCLTQAGLHWLYRKAPMEPAPHGELEVVDAPEAPGSDPGEVYFDVKAIAEDPVWRWGDPEGDRFTPWGHRDAHPLGRFLARAGVPIPLRTRLPVLACGANVLWVPLMRRGAEAPLTSSTRRALRASWRGRAWFDNAWRAPYHESADAVGLNRAPHTPFEGSP